MAHLTNEKLEGTQRLSNTARPHSWPVALLGFGLSLSDSPSQDLPQVHDCKAGKALIHTLAKDDPRKSLTGGSGGPREQK